MTDPLILVSNIFEAAKDIIWHETKWSSEDNPSNKTISSHRELSNAIKLGKTILAEQEESSSGVFCVDRIEKVHRDILVGIKDGLCEIAELLNSYTKKRSHFFSRTGSTIKEIGELVNTVTKYFDIYSTAINTGSSPEIRADEVIKDQKALDFWMAYCKT